MCAMMSNRAELKVTTCQCCHAGLSMVIFTVHVLYRVNIKSMDTFTGEKELLIGV